MHAGGGGRRRPDDLPAAILPPDRSALLHLVGFEVGAVDQAVLGLHRAGQQFAQRTAVERGGAALGDVAERERVAGLAQHGAGADRHAPGQEQLRQVLVERQIGGAVADAGRQIRRADEPALGDGYGGLHHVGERSRPITVERRAPGSERARHRDRERAAMVLPTGRLLIVGQRVGHGLVEVRGGAVRRGAQPVQYRVRAVREADMRKPAAGDADHHRLDHRQHEQGGNRRVDGVAAGEQDLRAGAGGERMVGHHHALRAAGGLLLAGEAECGHLSSLQRPGEANQTVHGEHDQQGERNERHRQRGKQRVRPGFGVVEQRDRQRGQARAHQE